MIKVLQQLPSTTRKVFHILAFIAALVSLFSFIFWIYSWFQSRQSSQTPPGLASDTRQVH